ncbi:non-ribosomal peptide synthetase [Streptomyces sp. NPDC006012]|uniref:non-ribosomal peptide synthetase n=1 Tax=Streptomyces sp. NPDC006012 TaxID=3364739 RepID=UPI0036CD4A8E
MLCLDLQLGRPPAPADAKALTDGETTLTYGSLHDLVVQEAAVLRRDGLGPGSLVALPTGERRTVGTIVSLLAILAAGAAFTPVPAGADGKSPVLEIVSDRSAWPGHLSPLSAPAYVFSTSGSSGAAKHTVVTREGLRNVFAGLYARFHEHVPPLAVWTQLHPLTFGFSMCEVLGSLTFNGTLALVDREEPVTFTALSRRLSEEAGPHVVCLTPSELSVLMRETKDPLPSHLVLSGEPAHRAPLREVFSRAQDGPSVVVNTYAATETSGQITADLVSAAGLEAALAGHVGRPLPGVEVVLLGQDDAPIPPGDTEAEGEIVVRGPTVSGGYLDPVANSEKFSAGGRERAFRTGDRGRWSRDGGLVVTGRSERRVKLTGHWTDLDEIERALTGEGLAAEAVAAVEEYTVDATSASRLLVAFVAPGAAGNESAARVRRRVLRMLDGQVTLRVIACGTIPRTANGKTDLAAMRQAPQAVARSGLAATVMGVWGELLGAGFSADANLFESGLDSLAVTAAAVRLTHVLGREVSTTFVFDHPRITLQIEALSGAVDPAEQRRVRQPSPLSSAADRRRAARRPDCLSVPPAHTEGVTQ